MIVLSRALSEILVFGVEGLRVVEGLRFAGGWVSVSDFYRFWDASLLFVLSVYMYIYIHTIAVSVRKTIVELG